MYNVYKHITVVILCKTLHFIRSHYLKYKFLNVYCVFVMIVNLIKL